MKNLKGSHLLILLLALIGGTVYILKKKMPPFEDGLHTAVVEAQSRQHASAGPTIAGCPVFPADNVWNTTIQNVPKDKLSSTYVDSIGPLHPLHPDFGSNLSNGIPYTLIGTHTPGVNVEFEYRDDSDLGHYPIPPDAPIEGGGDHHVILIDPERCVLFELYAAERLGTGSWKAGAGVKLDLTSNSLREEGKTSADAGGMPIFPGLIRYEEVQSGEIRHALRFTVQQTRASFVWPARHFASRFTDAKYPPMGQRFRLRADFDISSYSKTNQVILTAMKKYGMFLTDNGGSMFFSGVPDKRWNDDDLHHLSNVKAEDFEAIDESGLQLLANSARVDPKAEH